MKNENLLDVRDYVNISEFPILVCLTILDFKIIAFNRDPKNPNRIEGVFEKTEKLNRILNDYWNGDLVIDPKKFWSASRELKSRIRSVK